MNKSWTIPELAYDGPAVIRLVEQRSIWRNISLSRYVMFYSFRISYLIRLAFLYRDLDQYIERGRMFNDGGAERCNNDNDGETPTRMSQAHPSQRRSKSKFH